MSANYLELIKQVTQHLETIIEKTDSLVFWPRTLRITDCHYYSR